MAEKLDPRQISTFEELLMTVLYEQEAPRRVLVRKGLLTNDEVLEEVKRIVIVLIPFSYGANLQGANLRQPIGLPAPHVKGAKNWNQAFYSDDFLKELGLPLDHNERVKKKLAELEKEKKATGAEP